MKPKPPWTKRASPLPREFDFYALEDRVLLNGDSWDQGGGAEAAPDADWGTDDSGMAAPVEDAQWIATSDISAAEDLLPAEAEHLPLIGADDGAASDTTRTEVIFVDGAVSDSDTLIAGLRQEGGNAIRWVVVNVDEQTDGVDQITETLRGLRNVDAVHILSHGDGQGIQLGSARLDLHSASGYAGDIAIWANALTADADLLIYGCDLASTSDGQELLQSIASLTNADVAASDDLTGHESYGADWQLEYQLGAIDTGLAFTDEAQQQWNGALATFVVTNTSNSGAGSLRQAILDANAAVGSDTITFNIAGSGVQTINLTSALAKIQDTVTIDGYTQTGASANTLSTGDNAVLLIELNGAAAGGSEGLELDNGSDGSVIKGLIINRFGRSGIQISSENNLIVGNFIGTDSTGTVDLGNVIDGITISGHTNTIGGSSPASRNIISGNNDEGVDIDSGFTGNVIIGNYIGTNASGTAGIGNGSGGTSGGVVIDGSSNRVGGTAAGEGNIIAYNSGFGVFQTGAGAVGNSILGNSIYGNSDLGLDLKGDGLSSNDLGDGDSGSGNLQNFPVLSSAVTTGAQINLGGSLNSTANSYFRLEFFSSTTADANGHGEGQTYLGFANVTTDASGNATFNTSLTASVATSSYISGTATKANATFTTFTDTSEFAANVVATNTAPTLDASKTPVLSAINEDSGVPSGAVGTLVSALIDSASPAGQVDNVSDPDAGAQLGIAVTGANSANGTWYFTTDNGATWTALGAVSNTNSRLLAADANTRVYFKPSADYNGTITDAITFRAWDRTSGTNGGTAPTGGLSGTLLDTFSVTSYSNNDGTINWSSNWIENDKDGNGATAGRYYVANSTLYFTGSEVGRWIYREADLSQSITATFSFNLVSNALGGSEAVNVQVSGDGGATFTNLFVVSPGTAPGVRTFDISAYAASNTRIRFYDNGGGGKIVQFDDLQISAGGNGGITAFSTATDTASLVVNAVNDAPVLDNTGAPTLTSITEDQINNSGQTVAAIVASAGGDRITDVDSGASEGIAIYSLTSGNGTWQFSTDAGGTWNNIGTVSGTSALLLRSSDLVRFVPDGSNGTSADFSFHAWDQTSGTAGTKVSLASNGGTTAFSVASESATIVVTDVNDAPLITSNGGGATASISIAENQTAVTTVTSSDVDLPAQTITYSISGGADAAKFAINSTTGAVTFVSGRDRENPTDSDGDGVYEVDVQASDGSLTDVQSLQVTITDVNEFAVSSPTDGDAGANSVSENAANGTAVGVTAGATDADATSNTVTFTMVDDAGGRFAVDATTGVVTVANGSLLDRESAASHIVTIRATSADGSTADSNFTININDVDEFDIGAVTDSDATANAVDENAANGTVVGVTALASDADATAAITYTLDDDAGGRFAIHATTGVVTVADGTLLDRETASSHNITVRATSSDASFSTQAMTINVNDVDEFDVGAVTDSNATANAVDENAANGTVVGVTALASDADATTNSIAYTLDDDAGGRFAINATTGVVTVADGTLLDRETASSHNITVRATSSDASFSTQAMTINVNDVDEFDVGAVTDSNATANAVNENAANGTVVGVTALASDADATTNGITYTLDDDAGGRFAINATTGVVTVADGTLLDRETASSHNITVRATSSDASFSTQAMTISVNDVDEFNVGAVTDSNATANAVDENAANGTVVGVTALASDADATTNSITYTLDDNAGGRFAINATTGVVTVADGTLLDRETASSHNITVRATSSDASFSTQAMTINVNDVDEFNVGAVTDSDATANAVDENAANGTVVGVTALASDADATTSSITYTLDDDAGGRFAINATTGVVTVADGTLLDRETSSSHNITVRATSSDASYSTQAMTISVNDVDEFDVGAVTDSNATANAVDENAANGTVVGVTALASDADATTNSITYTLDDNAGGRFAIDATTGVVTVADGTLLDRETSSSHNITVRATSSDASFSTQAMTINVNDVDEFDVGAVTDSNATANAVNENAANGTVVGVTALASDADATTNSITYTLDDNAGGRFAINATTGVVTVADGTLLDRETSSSHNITVRATSSDASYSTQAMTINVNDVDEFDVAAVTDSNATANAVDENAANGTVVGVTALASDADATTSSITYTLDDNAGGRFAIDATTGVVTVADGTLLDRETASSHSITVRATSSDASFSTQAMTINVNDVDEFNVGAVTDSNATANAVDENAANGTVVGVTALASDADATTNSITYTLDDNAGGRFAIDATTGVVTVADGTLLDRETSSSHNITVRATSSDASFSTQAMTINVNDVDEFDVGAVTDSNATANAVNENAANGTVVGVTALASDADATTNSITYTLDDDAGGRFAINAMTGVVTVADGTLLDRETASSHNITVRATSSDASFSTQAVTINVNDVDEFDVGAVTDSNATANAVNENAANGTVVGVTALASDADATTNSVTYTLDDDAGGRFAINAMTGVVTVADGTLLDRETASSHNITVRATSSDASFSTQAMTINVNDVDEFDVGSVSDSDLSANAVDENAASGTVVGVTALASDADATTNAITYSLADNDGGRFAIDATTGVVTVAGAINRETDGPVRNINIQATSDDGSVVYRNMVIQINDLDESDVGVVSDADALANQVDENAAIGTLIGVTATASDADATASVITYSLVDDDGGRFAIDSTTGVVIVAGAIDREADGPVRTVTVRATSADGSTSDQSFAITVNDLDEFDVGAVVDSNATSNAVDENAANGTVVGVTALAGDADATTNSITYTLDDSAGGRFAIDATTGVVTVADGTLLDRETASSHSITIRATSTDASFSTQAMAININDVDEFDVGSVTDSNATSNAVDENAANGTVVGVTALASDADATTNSITYTLDDSAGGRFAIDATTGVVTVADGTLLDRETASSHSITVRAISSDTSFSMQAMTINVNDVDEFDVGTVVDSDATANAVDENAAIGTVVGVTASASDADATTNGISYLLVDDDGGRFAIDETTGVVTVAGAIDREADGPVRTITVRATSADGSSRDQSFAISINDLDEFDVGAAVDSDAAANAVDENAAIGTVVGVTASASDADATTNGISYALVDDDGGRFAIDSTTGVVTVAGAIDREADGPVRTITVRATSADGSTSDQSFAISLNDVDEFNVGAVVDSNAAANAVDENAAIGTVVEVTASASDADATTNGISYLLVDDDGGRFAIDETTGVVTVAGAIDREADGPVRTITVRAISTDGSSSDQSFAISINDLDEFDVGTVTDSDAAANAVDENAAIGTVVGVTASAGDGDATTNGISYSLVDDDGGRFTIDSTTGVVTVAGTLDYESDGGSRNITILATSEDGSSRATTLGIALQDVNDNAPVIASNNLTIVEGQRVTLGLSELDATDADSANLSFVVASSVGGHFERAGFPGQAVTLFTRAEVASGSIDFVHDGSETVPGYSLTVSDSQFTSGPAQANIAFTPVNDATTIAVSPAQVTYVENAAPLWIAPAAQLADSDSAQLSTLTVEIVGYRPSEDSLVLTGTTSLAVLWDGNSGRLTLSGPGSVAQYQSALREVAYVNSFENPSSGARRLEVVANDGQTASAVTSIALDVVAVNDAPLASGESYSMLTGGTLQIDRPGLLANDVDLEGDSLTTLLVQPPARGRVTITANGGLVYTPNAGFFGQEVIRYQVSDGSASSSIVEIQIQVDAVNSGNSAPPPAGPAPTQTSGVPAPVASEEGEAEERDTAPGDAPSEEASDDLAAGPAPGRGQSGGSAAGLSSAGEPQAVVSASQAIVETDALSADSGDRGGMYSRSIGRGGVEREGGLERSPSLLRGTSPEPDRDTSAQVVLDGEISADVEQSIVWSNWDQVQEDAAEEYANDGYVVGVVGTSASVITVGYTLWVIRGSVFAATVMGSVPGWGMVDPASLLQIYRDRSKESEDEVEKMLY